MHQKLTWGLAFYLCALGSLAWGQPYGEPDRGAPGDALIQAYLQREAVRLDAQFQDDPSDAEDLSQRQQYLEEYYYMLGLSPRPAATPLQATITGSIEGDGYVVDLLHYQSLPHLYVTANLYRPSPRDTTEPLPAVLYVCGHSGRGRNGNKVAFQSHGIWFARHGYICLVVDTLQLGEIAAIHHGTYNLERWWWHSRGYTPAGVEAWNGIRGIDYLLSRRDVDPERIGVTGISGGGAATFWVAAADQRVGVAVPVSGMADLESYVGNRVINGHCDCMFLYNTHRWPWTRIAGLVAPRPMLFVNSDNDRIFPMDANERIINRLERYYSRSGRSEHVDAVVSVGGHAYRQDIRQAVYRFLNTYLKQDPRFIEDSEIDVVSEGGNPGPYPIEPERLRVFPTDADLPADELNTTIDEHFVPLGQPGSPAAGEFANWKERLTGELRRVSFGYFPAEIPPARKLSAMPRTDDTPYTETLQAEAPLEFQLRFVEQPQPDRNILLVVVNEEEAGRPPAWLDEVRQPDQQVVLCEVRGIGATRWTSKNPPNYVERSHALLGRTVDTGRVWDVIGAAKYLRQDPRFAGRKVHVAGHGAAGVLAAYAALWCPEIEGVTMHAPPTSHMNLDAPQFLNVLRIADIPDLLGLIAPRRLTLLAVAQPEAFSATRNAYAAGGAAEQLEIK